LLAASLAATGIAHAAFPDKPLKIILPYAAGGPNDMVVRTIAEDVKKRFGQQVIIESKPGGSGLIAIQQVMKSPPDGYTMLTVTSTFAAHPGLFKQLPYDMQRDFTPLIRTVVVPILVLVHPSVPVKNIAELVEYSKKQPGGLYYATAGNASSPHITGEYFKSVSGINMTHVPYKGEAPAFIDLLGGQVKVMLASSAGAMPYIRSGRVKAIAVTTPARIPSLPAVPTVAESGFPNFEMIGWWGLMLPSGTPTDVVNVLYDAIRAALDQKEIKDKLADMGLYVSPQNPVEFKKYIADQTNHVTGVIRASNITAD
jgi:tripartite-type tricarboxylate transporter receptor subunit TctC